MKIKKKTEKKENRNRRGTGRYIGGVFCFAVSASLLIAAPVLASGTVKTAGYGPAWESENKAMVKTEISYNGDVNTLKTAEQTDQLLIAVGNPENPAKTTLSFYQKDETGILQQIFSVEAVSGMKGISYDKKEGDMCTPAGVYSFTMAFGIKEDPGSILPYRKVVNGDHFVDDGSSRYYNRYVNEFEVEKDWNSSENLIRQAPHYNYALVLDYNSNYTPGKGSAIFLHCPKTANNTGTSGCISIPEDYMRELVRTVNGNAKIIVAPDEKELGNF